MKLDVNQTIEVLLQNKLKNLSDYLKADVLSYSGNIIDGYENQFLLMVEEVIKRSPFYNELEERSEKNIIYVILTTGGGSARAVERYVQILRFYYDEVNFIVPDYAFSAGTIFCMSGDNIYMDFFSVLGPIDPQVQNKEGNMVPALGYLDKINDLIAKAEKGKISQAEFIILKDFDLAELRSYEQAKELTITLLKKWLVKYKFKNWEVTETSKTTVNDEYKKKRAEEIADKLSDNNEWKSHGRPIGIEILTTELNLKIEDYSKDNNLRPLIRSFYELLQDYLMKTGMKVFVQTRSK